MIPDRDGFDRNVVTVVPPAAPVGRYSLRLTFKEPTSGLLARSHTEITLE